MSPAHRLASILLFLACTLALASPAAAGEPPDQRAKAASEHFKQGMVHFQLDEYEAAIKEWQDGFREKPVAQFLYNIAQAYRLSRQPDKALSFYKKYLYMDPKAPNRAEVERHIATLTKTVEEEQAKAGVTSPGAGDKSAAAATPSREPSKPAEATPPPAAAAQERPAPSPVVAAPQAVEVAVAAPAPPPKKPITKKAWFWAVIVTSVVVVAGGVAAGVVLGTRSSGGPTLLEPARF